MMETRTIIAYVLIGVVVFAVVAVPFFWFRMRRPVRGRSRDKWSSLLKD